MCSHGCMVCEFIGGIPYYARYSVRLTACVTRWWVGRDNAILTEPTPSHENCLKTRRLPPVGCTLCWAALVDFDLLCSFRTFVACSVRLRPLAEPRQSLRPVALVGCNGLCLQRPHADPELIALPFPSRVPSMTME